jgi:hypothetical protein
MPLLEYHACYCCTSTASFSTGYGGDSKRRTNPMAGDGVVTFSQYVTIIVSTLISCLVCRNRSDDLPIKVLGPVPKGFQTLSGIPPASSIILLLEHAISKSFGRINQYKIIPDQELIAIGVTNMFGVLFLLLVLPSLKRNRAYVLLLPVLLRVSLSFLPCMHCRGLLLDSHVCACF